MLTHTKSRRTNKLKEIYVAGVRASYIKMYTYKESKKKGQRK